MRQARESIGWSLVEVGLKLNLTVTSLGNLEAGAFDKLPGHTFARGYIRVYAKLLGIDQTILVQEFDQFTGTDSQGSKVHGLGHIVEPARISHTILRIVSLLLLIAVIGSGFVWWQDQAARRTKDLTSNAMVHVEVESADGNTQIHTLDEPEDQVVVEAQDASDSPTTAEHSASQADTAPAATVAVPTSGVLASPVVQAHILAGSAIAPPTMPALIAGDGHIQITFVADCWTQVTDRNGKVLFSGLKRKGDKLDQGGKSPLTLHLGFARGAQVVYNGQTVNMVPFISGEIARLKLGK